MFPLGGPGFLLMSAVPKPNSGTLRKAERTFTILKYLSKLKYRAIGPSNPQLVYAYFIVVGIGAVLTNVENCSVDHAGNSAQDSSIARSS